MDKTTTTYHQKRCITCSVMGGSDKIIRVSLAVNQDRLHNKWISLDYPTLSNYQVVL